MLKDKFKIEIEGKEQEEEKEKLFKILITREVLDNDLKFLHKWLVRQLGNQKTKEFWDRTLGETLKRIQNKEANK